MRPSHRCNMSQSTMLDRVDVVSDSHNRRSQRACRAAFPVRRDARAGRRQFLDLLAQRHDLHAGAVREGRAEPFVEIPFPEEFRIGDVYAMTVFDLDDETHRVRLSHGRPVRPGTRATASIRPRSSARSLRQGDRRPRRLGRRRRTGTSVYQHRGRVVFEDFDWEDDRPLEIPDRRPRHLRDARPRLHRAPVVGRQVSPAPSPAFAKRSPTSRSSASTASS